MQPLFMSTSAEGQAHCSGSIIPSGSKVAKEAKLSSTGAECSGMPGESWKALTQSVCMCPAAKPSCTYPLRSFDIKRPLSLEYCPQTRYF